MSAAKPFVEKPSSWHISVSAEAFTAGQFARCGYDVSVQYGADQPEYDLIVAKGDHIMKVSVKGSQDGGWGLTQSYMKKATKSSGKKADYHGAIDLWLRRHGSQTVFCLVQFSGLDIGQLPRMYLASAKEVAHVLLSMRDGNGDSVLCEDWTYSRGPFAGTVNRVPPHWKFSRSRIEDLLKGRESGLAVTPNG